MQNISVVPSTKIRVSIIGFVLLAYLFFGVARTQAASFQFNPSTATFIQGCTYAVNVDIDATGENSNSADLEIIYDPTKVTILDSNPNLAGTQIGTGDAYDSYFAGQVDDINGRIVLSGGSFATTLSSRKVYATIEFAVQAGATAADFTIRFDGIGATTDSNVADNYTSNDLLTSVVNANYSFTTGSCLTDAQAPQVQFTSPQAYQTDIPENTNITFTITDNQSGVDLNSLQFILNGVTYTVNSPEISYTGTTLNYAFVLNPSTDLPANQESNVNVSGQDLSGNAFSGQIVFNIPETITPPVIIPPPGSPAAVTCDPTTSITQFLTNTNTVTIFQDTFLEGTVIDQVAQTVGGNTIINIITTTGFSLGFLQALTVLNTPGLIYNTLAFLLGRRRNKTWGIVVDAVTNKPIAFAACRLYLEGTLNTHQQTVSDTEGRYGFAIQPGVYRLEVTQSGYEKFTHQISVGKDDLGYVYDVKLYPSGLGKSSIKRNRLWDVIKVLYFQIRPYLFVAGLLLAIFTLLVSPSIINVIILALYVAILIINTVSTFGRKMKYASVIDSAINLRIPFATVKIFDLKTWELVDSQVTNSNGQFDFWGEPGEYALLVAIRGYEFPSSKQPEFPVIDEKYTAMLKVKLQRGYNKIQVFVDPTDKADASHNLATPFE